MRRVLLAGLLGLAFVPAGRPQTRLVLNGAVVRLTGGAALVVRDAAPAAITRRAGHVVSEGAENRVVWHVGERGGAYVVPFGTAAGGYLPLRLTLQGGRGAGAFTFATYPTPSWQDAVALPPGVTTLDGDPDARSARLADRFWRIEPAGFDRRPGFAALALPYEPGPLLDPGNRIRPARLGAVRWNDALGTWADFGPAGRADTVRRVVNAGAVPAADAFPWWALVDRAADRAADLAGLAAVRAPDGLRVSWTSLGERGGVRYTLERGVDTTAFVSVAEALSPGPSDAPRAYVLTDPAPLDGRAVYRLRITDAAGRATFSGVLPVGTDLAVAAGVEVFPNPARDLVTLRYTGPPALGVEVLDVSGRRVLEAPAFPSGGALTLDLRGLPTGLFVVRVRHDRGVATATFTHL